MKTTKRLLPYLVLLVLTLSLRYCINNSLWESKYVAFSSMPFEEKTPEPIALRSFEIPDSLWADTGTRLHYDTLSSEDQTVYRLLEYARDQRMTHLFLDQRLLDGTSRSIGEILTLFSMDSPLVEQNLDHQVSNSSIQSPVTGKAVSGKLVVVEQFSQEYWEKKMMALEKARSIVANILANKAISNTPIETARYFYTFLTQGTDYSLYGEDQTPHYLYDALVAKKTQCDGYANAFSLLCNLAGIPC